MGAAMAFAGATNASGRTFSMLISSSVTGVREAVCTATGASGAGTTGADASAGAGTGAETVFISSAEDSWFSAGIPESADFLFFDPLGLPGRRGLPVSAAAGFSAPAAVASVAGIFSVTFVSTRFCSAERLFISSAIKYSCTPFSCFIYDFVSVRHLLLCGEYPEELCIRSAILPEFHC